MSERKGGPERDRGPWWLLWDRRDEGWLMAGPCLHAAPQANQPGSGRVVSRGAGARWEADSHPAASQPNSGVPFLDPKDPRGEVPGLGKSGGWPARGGWPTLTGELPAGRPAPASRSSRRIPGVLRGSPGREESAAWTLEVSFKTGGGGESAQNKSLQNFITFLGG